MRIDYFTLETCAEARGTVVVIDVCRAFTTAAYAFAAGAAKIYPVSGIDEAFALREKMPSALLMGEQGGLPIEGFDFGNSPQEFSGMDLNGRALIQRTSAGTQGVARSRNAPRLYAASFVVAAATVRRILREPPEAVGFVITGIHHDFSGEEDIACADYMAELLRGNPASPDAFLDRARDWPPNREQIHDRDELEHALADLELCLAADRFNFTMPISAEDGRAVMVKR